MPARRRSAPSAARSHQLLAHADVRLVAEAEPLVERAHAAVVRADLQVDLGTSERAQPPLDLLHQLAPDPAAAMLGVDGEVVDPAPEAVVPAEHGADHAAAALGDQEQLAL